MEEVLLQFFNKIIFNNNNKFHKMEMEVVCIIEVVVQQFRQRIILITINHNHLLNLITFQILTLQSKKKLRMFTM